MNSLIDALQDHIKALQRRAEHHRIQKMNAVSPNAANDHLMCLLELTRQADDLKAILQRHTSV